MQERGVMSFQVSAIAATELDRVRADGVDDLGNELRPGPASGGEPLRCCLRDASEGEDIVLIGYRPNELGGPYAETGPVFVHAAPCAGYGEPTAYPAGFRDRTQVFRSYGPDGRIVDGEVVAGADADAAIERLLARPEVARIDSRNVTYGCYMFRIERGA
jgi:hypothetical protein